MYQTSTDYEKLLEHLCAGETVAAFADYRPFGDNGEIVATQGQDICMVRRKAPFDIYIGVRGQGYAPVYPFMNDGQFTELEVLAQMCRNVNLRWIVPGLDRG